MAAVIVELRDAVVDDLNGTTFSQAFTAAGVLLPRWKLEEIATLRVSVLGAEDSGTRGARGMFEHEQTVQVLVQKRLDTSPNAVPAAEQQDAHLAFVQELMDHFESVNPAPTVAALTEVKWAPLFVVADLEQHNTLTSVLGLTFRSWRTV